MKKIMIGADIFPPYQFIDNDGKIIGQDVEKIREVFQNLNIPYFIQLGDWDTIYTDFLNGEIDVLFQIQKTKEREQQFYFSKIFRKAKTIYVAGTNSKKIENLSDQQKGSYHFATISGFQYGNFLDHLSDKIELSNETKILEYVESHDQVIGVIDNGVYNYLNNSQKYNVHIVSTEYFIRDLYVAFREKSMRDLFNENYRI